ncbi:MAG: acetate kinase [Planctomycetaceae bacterium]|nr:acetate kinase [Planctomycetaceae bacterium]
MKVLVVNCGSSSIKYQLYEMPEKRVISKGLVERIGEEGSALQHHYADEIRRLEGQIADHEEGMALILETLTGPDGVLETAEEIGAVGHRVVHGGEEFTGSVLITPEVIASIERFADLAPLHNPPNLTGIRAAMHELPDVPQVACFDTAFHATIPEVAYTYALPYQLYEKFGIRRYGFHGTSHRYVARRAAELLGIDKYALNCITIHLGNGSSMTAVRGGRSVDTSMGLTPLEGLVMGTRTGDFDPAILFYLADRGYDVTSLNKLCNKQSGLLGISGKSNDMRTLLQRSEQGDRRAKLAIDVFCYRIKKYIGMYMAVLGRVDAIVFTGGIGENASAVRANACSNLEGLGIALDAERNEQTVARREGAVSTPESPTAVLVIPTDEEAAIADDTYRIMRSNPCLTT